MKATLYLPNGESKGTVELPKVFSTIIRDDLVRKLMLASIDIQPYGSAPEAGRRHSAAGTISHKRHDWKGHYGRGISRAPRKTMWRRGTQFFWIGAETSAARGGRRAHGPKKIEKRPRQINKKEYILAMSSGIAATASNSLIEGRYSSISKFDSAPFVLESLPSKTKEMTSLLKKILGEHFSLAMKSKVVRAGKGKTRGRKYKSNAGVLIVTGTKETHSMKGFEIKPVDELNISDLYPLGRITIYTKKALEELDKLEAKSK